MNNAVEIARQVSSKFEEISQDEVELISVRENGRKGAKLKYSIKVGTHDADYYFDGNFNLKASCQWPKKYDK